MIQGQVQCGEHKHFHPVHCSKFNYTPQTVIGYWSAFSWTSLYPKTEHRLNHPPLEVGGLVTPPTLLEDRGLVASLGLTGIYRVAPSRIRCDTRSSYMCETRTFLLGPLVKIYLFRHKSWLVYSSCLFSSVECLSDDRIPSKLSSGRRRRFCYPLAEDRRIVLSWVWRRRSSLDSLWVIYLGCFA